MSSGTTSKRSGRGDVSPNMPDYARARSAFSWERARRDLDGLPGGRGLNIAHEAVDRHAASERAGHTALRWRGKGGARVEWTYADLAHHSARFANALVDLGVGAGERVFTLLGRVPDLYVAAMGTLKNRSVLCPLFSAFGPEPVRQRLAAGEGRVLVTSERLYERKVAPVREVLPALEHVLLIPEGSSSPRCSRERSRGSRSRPPIPKTWRCSTSPAVRRVARRERCTCTRRSSRITPPRASPSIFTPETSSGARRIQAGSRARPTV
jgi:acetyl-CoA synthetase